MSDDIKPPKRQKPITLGRLILLFVFIAFAVGFVWNRYNVGSLTNGNPVITPTPSVTTQPTFGTSGSDEDIREIVVTAKNYSFSPSTITVNKGEKIRLVLESTEGTHDITIEEIGVSTQLVSEGYRAWVDFVADTEGVFEFYCSVNNHKELGMVGTFIVQ